MKSLFDCKEGQVSEKALSSNVIVSFLSIILCLIALCSMTYAWFTESSVSNSNTLVSGRFDFEVYINKSDDTTAAGIITPVSENEEQGSVTYNLSRGTYTVILDLNNDSTAKGYCTVKIGGVEKHTGVIVGEHTVNREDYALSDPFEFTMIIEADNTVVEFKQHWGVSASSFVEKDHTYTTDDWNDASDE